MAAVHHPQEVIIHLLMLETTHHLTAGINHHTAETEESQLTEAVAMEEDTRPEPELVQNLPPALETAQLSHQPPHTTGPSHPVTHARLMQDQAKDNEHDMRIESDGMSSRLHTSAH